MDFAEGDRDAAEVRIALTITVEALLPRLITLCMKKIAEAAMKEGSKSIGKCKRGREGPTKACDN